MFSVKTTANREFMQKMPIASLSNYEVTYTGQDLQQDDLSVWMSLINLARNQPMSDSILFTGYALIKDLGWRMHSESYKRAQESIERLKVTGIEISTNNKETAYSGSLIREYAWTAKDVKGNARWMVRFEPRVSTLFMEDTTTLLEWETRKKIGTRATVAQWLHSFYSSHREPIPLKVEKLYELCRSGDSLSSFRRNIKNALNKLVDVEFLTTFSIVNDTVRVQKKLRPKLVRAK
ncbi:replication initiator protein A (plasmid) [Polaromonas sp. P1-6]|nr:replication initiator protein A [Polaromonas sp. P1-6]